MLGIGAIQCHYVAKKLNELYVVSHSTVTHVTFSLKIKFKSCINSIITTVDL